MKKRLVLLLFGSLVHATFAGKVVLTASKVKFRQGEQVGTSKLEVLNTKDQSGTAKDPSKYIEISAGKKDDKFLAEFIFKFTGKPEKVKTMKIVLNSLGSNTQGRTVSIRKGKKWQKILDSSKNANGQWTEQTFEIEKKWPRYFKNGTLRIRIESNNDAANLLLDYLVVEVKAKGIGGGGKGGGKQWYPKASEGLTWQWQLQGKINTKKPLKVDVYDIDLFDTSEKQIRALQKKGIRVICYFSAGSYEGWREDWSEFFSFIKGKKYKGDRKPFAGKMANWNERWLDIREIELLRPIMTSRMKLAKAKGCDAVEPDNVDAYTNGKETGLSLTAADQLAYNKFIAELAHDQGLSVALKNDIEQLGSLVDDFDFAINEQCFEFNECSKYNAFTSKDKAVFGAEYKGEPKDFCPKAEAAKLSFQKKRLSLKSYRVGCEEV